MRDHDDVGEVPVPEFDIEPEPQSAISEALHNTPVHVSRDLLLAFHSAISLHVLALQIPIDMASAIERAEAERHVRILKAGAAATGESWTVEQSAEVLMTHFLRRQAVLRDGLTQMMN